MDGRDGPQVDPFEDEITSITLEITYSDVDVHVSSQRLLHWLGEDQVGPDHFCRTPFRMKIQAKSSRRTIPPVNT